MARHIITVEQIQKWIDHEVWYLAASSYGNLSDKKIEMSNSGAFRVTDNDKIVYAGYVIRDAVDAYNAAP